MQFDAESHDFGTIFQMRSHECVFKFRNAGTATLVVDGAFASCGCTATLLSLKEIEPGEEAELKVELKSGMYTGEISKNITVRSNDPDEPVKKVQVKANIVARLALEPKRLYLRQVRKSEGVMASLSVQPSGLEEIRSIESECTTEQFHTKLEPADGKEHEYRLTVSVADEAPLGRVAGQIKFYLNGESEPCALVPVTAHLVGDIDVSPRRFMFRTRQGTEDDLGAITLTKGTRGTFRILGVDSDIPTLSAEVSTVEEGTDYAVTVRLAPDAPAGQTRGTITIRTDDTYQPNIKLAVLGIVD